MPRDGLRTGNGVPRERETKGDRRRFAFGSYACRDTRRIKCNGLCSEEMIMVPEAARVSLCPQKKRSVHVLTKHLRIKGLEELAQREHLRGFPPRKACCATGPTPLTSRLCIATVMAGQLFAAKRAEKPSVRISSRLLTSTCWGGKREYGKKRR